MICFFGAIHYRRLFKVIEIHIHSTFIPELNHGAVNVKYLGHVNVIYFILKVMSKNSVLPMSFVLKFQINLQKADKS